MKRYALPLVVFSAITVGSVYASLHYMAISDAAWDKANATKAEAENATHASIELSRALKDTQKEVAPYEAFLSAWDAGFQINEVRAIEDLTNQLASKHGVTILSCTARQRDALSSGNGRNDTIPAVNLGCKFTGSAVAVHNLLLDLEFNFSTAQIARMKVNSSSVGNASKTFLEWESVIPIFPATPKAPGNGNKPAASHINPHDKG